VIDIHRQLDRSPDAICLESRDGKLSYAEVDGLVQARARELGDRNGGQVVVRPRIDVESVVEFLAVARAGGTAVAVSPNLPEELAAEEIAAADTESRPSASILFTSGTAGQPKGVRLTESNWEAAAQASIDRLGHGADDRWLCPLPLHHVGGLSIIYRTISAGGSVVLAPEPADLTAWMPRVSFASVVPTQLHRVLRARTDAFSYRLVVLVGGGPVAGDLLDMAETAGIVALPTYGMTETTSQLATARPGDSHRKLFPMAGVEVRIGPEGRIEARGPTVSPGYIGEPERPPEDWFPTADRGRVEVDGSLVVLGRLDRMILSGGENIDPARIEAVIAANPEVSEVAIVALPDVEWGEIVAAAYTGSASAEDLTTELTEHLPSYALPKRWLHLDALPKTELGKIDTQSLVKLFLS
jgi:o-succinylbenzoate---CoA ligase